MSDASDTARQADELLRRDRWQSVRAELPGVCETIGEICGSKQHAFSLPYLAQRLSSSAQREAIVVALDSTRYVASSTAALFRVLDELKADPSQEQIGIIVQMIRMLLDQVRRLGMDPFVRLVRDEGSADGGVIDGYRDFQRRWDQLINRTEQLSSSVAVPLDLSIYHAKDLSVPLKR